MHASRRTLLALSAVTFSALALAPRPALADTYQLYTVDHTQAAHFAAGDDAGDFAINTSPFNPCGPFAPRCYLVGSALTGPTSLALTLPTLGKGASYTSRLPVDPPYGPQWSNIEQLGGIFAGTYTSGATVIRGIFDGADPFTDLLSHGSIEGGLVSRGGTVFFTDGLDNTLVVALDTSIGAAPEPTTLALFGTGASGLAALLTRRRRAR